MKLFGEEAAELCHYFERLTGSCRLMVGGFKQQVLCSVLSVCFCFLFLWPPWTHFNHPPTISGLLEVVLCGLCTCSVSRWERGGWQNDGDFTSVMHDLSASPAVQLFINCQGRSTAELWESMQAILTGCSDTGERGRTEAPRTVQTGSLRQQTQILACSRKPNSCCFHAVCSQKDVVAKKREMTCEHVWLSLMHSFRAALPN